MEIARSKVNLVRAYYVLDDIAGQSKLDNFLEIRFAYIDSLRDLLELADLYGLVSHTSNCDKYSKKSTTGLYIFLEINAKNNFSSSVAEDERMEYRKEAWRYSEELGKYRVKNCLDSVLDERQQHRFSIEFLDTFALVKQIFAIHDRRASVIPKKEFECLTKKAVSAWEDALVELESLDNLIEVGVSSPERPSRIRRKLEHRLRSAKQMLGGEGCCPSVCLADLNS